jgi:hypothetical protein
MPSSPWLRLYRNYTPLLGLVTKLHRSALVRAKRKVVDNGEREISLGRKDPGCRPWSHVALRLYRTRLKADGLLAIRTYSWKPRTEPIVRRLRAGGKWIRTFGSARDRLRFKALPLVGRLVVGRIEGADQCAGLFQRIDHCIQFDRIILSSTARAKRRALSSAATQLGLRLGGGLPCSSSMGFSIDGCNLCGARAPYTTGDRPPSTLIAQPVT